MNLAPLFEKQRALDAHILETHPELKGADLLPDKILALQVELGELANEFRGFKFWSNDQKPRTKAVHDDPLAGIHVETNPLLEEYVDCLHFILSIGLEIGADKGKLAEWFYNVEHKDATIQFLSISQTVLNFIDCKIDD